MKPTLQSAQDTIAAIATPIGESGLAVIRISGPEALQTVDKCFAPIGSTSTRPTKASSHTIQYGRIMDHEQHIDEVMISVFRAPRTFTREDTVEISTHGGILPAKLVMETLLQWGVRMAAPGEFTLRAFLNGRIDLTQAEAVADVIHSRTERALTAANEQLAGKLGNKVRELRDELVALLAHIEAHIDFPDEDISPDTKQQMEHRILSARSFMDALLSTSREGRVLRQGVRAVIVGRTNAGKSSLLNELLGQERAIVSDVEGTTRDTIEEMANIRGIPIIFIDTAGLRESSDPIEKEGIRRSKKSIKEAELVLHIVDGSRPLRQEDLDFIEQHQAKQRIHILNKSDLSVHSSYQAEPTINWIPLSCETHDGVETLREAIYKAVWSGKVPTEMLEVMINSRHQDALKRGLCSLKEVSQGLSTGLGLELVAMDLRISIGAIGEIVGETTTDDLLDSIFSQFCLGK
jgi:tRNA modification GTPase